MFSPQVACPWREGDEVRWIRRKVPSRARHRLSTLTSHIPDLPTLCSTHTAAAPTLHRHQILSPKLLSVVADQPVLCAVQLAHTDDRASLQVPWLCMSSLGLRSLLNTGTDVSTALIPTLVSANYPCPHPSPTPRP